MFCIRCGAQMAPGDSFCRACGASSDGTQAPGSSEGLRPLGVAERVDAAIKAFRSNYRAMLSATVVVVVLFALLEALVSISISGNIQTTTNADGTSSIDTSSLWSAIAGLSIVSLLTWMLTTWASATCIQIVGGSFVSADIDWREARRNAFRRIGSLLWVVLLSGAIMVGPFLLVALVGLILASAASSALGWVVVAIMWLPSMVWFVWFVVAQSLSIPSLMLEDVRGLKAIRRSMALVKGSWWSVFGTLVLMELLVIVVAIFLGIIFLLLNNVAGDATSMRFVTQALERTANLLIVTPFTATVYVIVAIDMRIRKEGFDLELLARELEAVREDGHGQLSAPPSFPSLDEGPKDAPGDTAGTSTPDD